MSDFSSERQLGDAAMRRGDFRGADDHYLAAWNGYTAERRAASDADAVRQFDTTHTPEAASWLLLSGADAQFRRGDFEGCFDTCVTAFNLFKDLGLVVGNPFFHLRLGQAAFELEPPEDRDPRGTAIDNLARALICGGIEIFRNEDAKYLEPILQVLQPPQGFASWQDAVGEGCSTDKLDGATGYLAGFIAAKYPSLRSHDP